jgi:hypothetical protein
MSRDRNDDEPGLDASTLRALRDADDLIPTTDAEVERAEATLSDDLELPQGLRSYEPPASRAPDNVRKLPQQRPRWLTHSAAAGLGALAAGLAFWWLRPEPVTPVTAAGGELVRPSSSAPAAHVPIVFRSRCERECCGGTACQAASEALRACPSGARCVGCGTDNVSGGPYRLRLGTLVPSEAGQQLLPPGAPLELCVVATNGNAQCLPALGETNGDSWRLLKTVVPLQELLLGLHVQLRKRGETQPLASWKHPVTPTPDVMCKGLAIQLGADEDLKEGPLGRLSAFIEQTHFVELSRAAAVPQLLKTLARFDVSGIEPRIFETSRAADGRFALVFGPLDKADADALRWQVLDHGVEANVSHGLDFIGSSRPAR